MTTARANGACPNQASEISGSGGGSGDVRCLDDHISGQDKTAALGALIAIELTQDVHWLLVSDGVLKKYLDIKLGIRLISRVY